MFDLNLLPRKRIAIVGGGISGLSAAYFLSLRHDVTLFEAERRLGGHAHSVLAGRDGGQPVDMGFIVFNYATYPHLTRLFAELDVPVRKSNMSFGVSIDEGRVEYALSSLGSLFAQKRNLLRPSFYRMIADILRFGRKAEAATGSDDMTVGELVAELQLGTAFRDHYLLPMCGAIWSTPAAEVGRFPARTLVRFFRNHALLAGSAPHQWWTVKGGSIEYVRRLEKALLAQGCMLQTGSPVQAVRRDSHEVRLTAAGSQSAFDEVVFACHSDQALTILGEAASEQETAALETIRYRPNRVVLHADPSLMPKRRACWSSWNYFAQEGAVGVTYWMNQLQGIPESDPLFVSLNPTRRIAEETVYRELTFAHPAFDTAAIRAQQRIAEIQGRNRTWYCGAYNRFGFHEDGIASSLRVVRRIGLGAQGGEKGIAA